MRDPVCGKEVDGLRARAVGIWGGRTFYFCSAEHRAAFARDPGAYREGSGMVGMTGAAAESGGVPIAALQRKPTPLSLPTAMTAPQRKPTPLPTPLPSVTLKASPPPPPEDTAPELVQGGDDDSLPIPVARSRSLLYAGLAAALLLGIFLFLIARR